MKHKLLIAGILILFSSGLTAQSEAAISAEENEFASITGTLIETTYIEVGKFEGINFFLEVYRFPAEDKVEMALRLKYRNKTLSGLVSNYNTVLDMEEITPLKKAIEVIMDKVEWQVDNETEIKYISRDEARFGAYSSTSGKSWSGFIKLHKSYSDSFIKFDVKQLPNFLTLLTEVEKMAATVEK